MKKLFFSLISALCIFSANAQNINADCINAIPLCSTPSFTFNATSGVGTVADICSTCNISNPTTNPYSSNGGCLLSGELKPQWLLITVGNAGNLEFVFGAGNSANPQAGYYDWAMWPYNPNTCTNIQNNTLPPIRCNWNGTSSGGTGVASASNIPTGGSPSNYEPPLPVLPCQQFIICISNYSGVNTLVSFQSLGTASLTCNPSCLNVNSPALCAGSSASIIALSSGNVANLTYSINPGGITSTTPTFVINPTTSTNYTVYATGLNSNSVAVTQTAVSSVTVFPQPLAAPTVTQATCTNPSNGFDLGLGFNPSGASPAYTVTWSGIPQGITSPTQTALSGTLLPGVYTASITAAGGCYTTTSFTINANPAPASVVLIPPGPVYSVTCFDPTVTVNAMNTAQSYTWNNNIVSPMTGPIGTFAIGGSGVWTITAENPVSACVATKTIAVTINTTAPTSIVTPTFQNITCNLTSITTVTATASPTVNILHQFIAPSGAIYSPTSYSATYPPFGTGTYTHCVINSVNGCSTCKQFTVASNQGFPSFNVVSPQNFTLGCGIKSSATISIINGDTSPPGGPVSYTVLNPGSSSVTLSGSLSIASVYSINQPGTYTVITKDNTSFCETRIPVSVISNTQGPVLASLNIPSDVLSCSVPQVTFEATSAAANTMFNWAVPGTGNYPTNTLVVNANTTAPTSTVVGTYTLSLTDPNNTCVTTTLIPIRQNLFAPRARISNGGVSALTCSIYSLTLSNISTTGIPPGSIFQPSIVVAETWEGPSPQVKLQLSSTYVGLVAGEYTMTARDLSNGCTSRTVITIGDNKVYPAINSPSLGPEPVLDCGASNATIVPVINNATTALTYSWYPYNGTQVGKNFLTPFIGIYRLVVTNTLNGCASSAIYTVTNGALTAGFVADKEEGYAPLAVTFTNTSASTTGTSNIVTNWNFGNGRLVSTASASISPQMQFVSPGTYTVTAHVVKGLCVQKAFKLIEVLVPSSMEVPNIFTPNGDGVNDVYFIRGTSLQYVKMEIFDRWGSLVYAVENTKGIVDWDGNLVSGGKAAEGTYFYTLKTIGNDGVVYERKGNITLVR